MSLLFSDVSTFKKEVLYATDAHLSLSVQNGARNGFRSIPASNSHAQDEVDTHPPTNITKLKLYREGN